MDAKGSPGSVGARAARIVAPFLIASIAWVFLSDLNPLRFGDPQRFARCQLLGDVGFVLAILYALHRTIASSLAKSDAAARSLERKVEEERKLLEELQLLAHAIDGSPVSVVITDKDGNIEFVNRKFCAITGYSAAEVRGKNPRLLKSGATSPEEYRRMWETISAGKEWRGVFHNRRKDGGTFWENSFISGVRDEAGLIRHYIAVKEDITEKRSLEAQLVQAQKMESLGALAGGVAHDFNNLLTVIQGHCELLAMSAASAPGTAESVAEIRAAAERAASMTRRLLQFSRRQPMHARVLDLRKLVWDEVRMLGRLAGEEHPLRLSRPAAPLYADADANMIGLVLMNLVLNARDAMKSGGPISISLAAAAPDVFVPAGIAASTEGFVVLEVADRGCGIAESDQRRIFEPFFTTKAAGAGTGLGLSVVDGIVRQHKGWIDVDSAVGRGATFRVYLPRAPQSAVQEDAPEPAAAAGGTDTVLLVEDDAALRAVAARALRSVGYRVTEAADGAAAVLAWERRPEAIDLLLTDMTMPGGMNGVDLARRLRRDSPALRVLVISGHHRDLPTDSATIGDGFAFLAKPFVPAQLTAAVRAALDRPADPPARG